MHKRSGTNRAATQRRGGAASGWTVLLGAIALYALGTTSLRTAKGQKAEPFEKYTEKIPNTVVEFDMLPIPGGAFEMKQEDGTVKKVEVKPFWMSQYEQTWDEYDIYAYKLDLADKDKPKEPADAVARPTKPYGAPDRGFGHEGYPAISMTFKAATHYCEWLSLKTGKKYRLPTEAEWELAARAGQKESPTGDALDKVAWYWDNADDTTHPTGQKAPNALGLYDMLGNVAEWCVGMGKDPVVRGGSFDDDPEDVTFESRAKWEPDWQVSDPQDPKSPWWLSDATHVGYRIVRSKE